MIRLMKLDDHTYLVEYKGEVKRVIDNIIRRRKDKLIGYRHVIGLATKLKAAQFRHYRNIRSNGKWVSEWLILA